MIGEYIGLAIIAAGLLLTIVSLFTHGPGYHARKRGASKSTSPQPTTQEGKNESPLKR